MDELFELWRDARPSYRPFSNDGILLPKVWDTQSTKIAFILKEPNDGFYNIRGSSYDPRSGNSKSFWRNINMWSYTVKQLLGGASITYDDAYSRKEDAVGHIAYINLKKRHEGLSVSDHADIQGYVDSDWEFIEHQLRIVSPDVLFCGGTYRYIRNRMVTTRLADKVFSTPGRTIIDFYHPSCRIGYKRTFEILNGTLSGLNIRSY